jgi:hypothetical protein
MLGQRCAELDTGCLKSMQLVCSGQVVDEGGGGDGELKGKEKNAMGMQAQSGKHFPHTDQST